MTEQQERLRELAEHYNNGLLAPSDGDILAVILSPTGRPSKRMARIAMRMVATCGLQGVAEELANLPMGLMRFGLSSVEVNRLKMAYDFVARCHLLNRVSQAHRIRSVVDAIAVCRPEMVHLDHEEMHVLVLDTKHQPVEHIRLYKGTVHTTAVRAAEIFRPAIVRNCPSIILFHNHPSGDATASPEDKALTYQFVEAGKVLDIDLLDHIIIGNPYFTSLKDELQW